MYTRSEQTVKKYTVRDAVKAAEVRLKGVPLCVNALKRRSYDDKITLAELNDLADQMVDESNDYDR
jgi:hypothetical protein